MEETTMILAYVADDGRIGTMRVDDRHKFVPGVTTTVAWDAMDEAGRAALAAKGSRREIELREQAQAAGRAGFRKAHKGLAQWMNGSRFMYEGRGDGVIEWERTAVAGVWRASGRNVIVTERWNGDSNDWEHQARPAAIDGQPRHRLRRTAEEAEADSQALRDSAPRITTQILRELAAAGAGTVLAVIGGELRIEADDSVRGVIAHAEYAAEVAAKGDEALAGLAAYLQENELLDVL